MPATVWLRLTVPFSTVLTDCASASLADPLVVPPMTKMVSQLMGTTATPSLGLESDATLLHDCFNIATSAVEIPCRSQPPMITGGHELGMMVVRYCGPGVDGIVVH